MRIAMCVFIYTLVISGLSVKIGFNIARWINEYNCVQYDAKSLHYEPKMRGGKGKI